MNLCTKNLLKGRKPKLLKRTCFRLLCLIAGVTFLISHPVSGETNAYSRAAAKRDKQTLSDARKKRSEILSKRHNMRDQQQRADVVRQLKQVEKERMNAVRRRAAAGDGRYRGQILREEASSWSIFDEHGYPVYEEDQNVNAAITTAANEVRSSATYNGIDGSSVTIGLWEAGGIPRVTHRELSGRVTVMDGYTSMSSHATHVSGTLISQGINAATRGMAPGASIAAFQSSYDEVEMLAYGASEPGTTNLYLSNHSYGVTRGWKYDDGVWNFRGAFSDDGDQSNDVEEDYGRYNYASEDWDGIAYNLPYYLIFKSAGNQRSYNTPDEGETWIHNWVEYTYNPAQHPLSSRDYKGGWDNMEGASLAKNVIAVGNANDAVTGGIRDVPAKASAYSSSSRGPADDGRIKPDLYGNGVSLTSCDDDSDTDTTSKTGTSMAAPNCSGSAALLIDYYTSRFPGGAMRASTLKALILHTADDRGDAGPDYKYGWGIMNTSAAAGVIKAHADNPGSGILLEAGVDTGITSQSRSFGWDGSSPLRVTLCWTDPASEDIDGHDNRTKALVNDLNLKVVGPDGIHYPYVMPYVAAGDWNENKIDDNAITGVNVVDNVEQVYLAAPVAGTYQVVVDYVGTLTNDEQIFSLVVTGQDGLEFTELEVWRTEYFGTTNVSGDLADEADYDNDGYANLMEFGLATSPTVSNADPVEFSVDPANATLTYPRNLNSTNAYDFEMIWSDNLLSNNWSTMSVIEHILSESGTVQQVESSLPMGSSSNRYFRLQIKKK